MTIPEVCPKCQNRIKHIPQGISKRTGKPYNEFWACEVRDCDFTWRKPKEDNEALTGLREIYKLLQEIQKEQRQFFRIFKDMPDSYEE